MAGVRRAAIARSGRSPTRTADSGPSSPCPTRRADRGHSRARSPIDAFLSPGARREGLKPSPPADRRTLIRRATFDLIGLPPTPEEIDAFLADTVAGRLREGGRSPAGSPHYGERWGRHWLDVVRYADTAGETADYPVPRGVPLPQLRDRRLQPATSRTTSSCASRSPATSSPRTATAGTLRREITATGFLAISRRSASTRRTISI